MPQSDFLLNIEGSSNISLLYGSSTSLTFNIKNLSTTDYLYNVSLAITLPNGLSINSQTLTPSSIAPNPDNSNLITFSNLTDLAPLETDFKVTIGITSNLTYANGTLVPVATLFQNITTTSSSSTMPRGSLDPSNSIYMSSVLLNVQTVKYLASINLPEKVLKGAGTSVSTTNYTNTYLGSFSLTNSTGSITTISPYFLLEDGIRYIGNIIATGPDNSYLSSPSSSTVTLSGKTYTKLTFGTVRLSSGSTNTFSFKFAVWNKRTNNTGVYIPNETPLVSKLNIQDLTDQSVSEISKYTTAYEIMTTSSMDTGNVNLYMINIATGGYYSINNTTVYATIPDGYTYSSSSPAASSQGTSSANNGTLLTFLIGTMSANTHQAISIRSSAADNYTYKLDALSNPLPVVAGDSFVTSSSVTGNINVLNDFVMDSSSVSTKIPYPMITKSIVALYYRDGSLKPTLTPSQNDIIEYEINYNSQNVNTTQKSITIFDFFPPIANPINSINYVYTGYFPQSISPTLTDPHGVRFNFGNIPKYSTSSIKFKTPLSMNTDGGSSTNLAKVVGYNTDGVAYSYNDSNSVTFGSPNLIFQRNVTGNNINNILPGETYNVSITLTNQLGANCTDAFNFTINESIPTSLFDVDTNSISVNGTCDYGTYTLDNGVISIPITKVEPGETINLIYSITAKSSLIPSLQASASASITNPYSQAFDAMQLNYQYNLSPTSSVLFKTPPLGITALTTTTGIKVGSTIRITINSTIPAGTVLSNVQVRDLLPDILEYSGNATLNGDPITANIISNDIVMFPLIETIDATLGAVNLVYEYDALVLDVNSSLGALTTTHNNYASATFTSATDPTPIQVDATMIFTVNHPRINTVVRASSSLTFTTTNISSAAGRYFYVRVSFTNNSTIPITDAHIYFNINNSVNFVSIESSSANCLSFYNSNDSNVTGIVSSLGVNESGFFIIKLQSQAATPSNTTLSYRVPYTTFSNDISNKLYTGAASSYVNINFPCNFTFIPSANGRVDDSTLYVITPRGSTTVFTNNIVNTGSGLDSYTLTIAAAPIAYNLYIGTTFITSVSYGQPLNLTHQLLNNVYPGQLRRINFEVYIPIDTPLTAVYNFYATITSQSNPLLTKTIRNIDPFYDKSTKK
ncbi:MAG: hypothetical protein RR838_02035 [Clostridium sp.]